MLLDAGWLLFFAVMLDRFGILASMSRKGDCWDNAVAESFFSTLKTELGADRIYESRDEATMIIREYIDEFYNTTRWHSHLGYLSPIEYELRSQVAAAAASLDCPLDGVSFGFVTCDPSEVALFHRLGEPARGQVASPQVFLWSKDAHDINAGF